MRHFVLPSALTLALAASGCAGSTGTNTPLPQQSALQQNAAQQSAVTKSATRSLRAPLGVTSILPQTLDSGVMSLCAKPTDGVHAGCFASVRTASSKSSSGAFSGLTPLDLSYLYAYPSPAAQGSAGSGQTVAIVTVGDYAAAEADLAVYRSHFGLGACTSANGCLRKLGVGSLRQGSVTGNSTSITAHATTASTVGWAAETDADIELISAVCPNCKILIAEATTDSLADLTNAVSSAVSANASIVNASFGALETSADVQYSYAYNNSKHTKVVAAAGDWGFGVYYPASDPGVIAVGGTTLSLSGTKVSEAVWTGTGSGCSAIFGNPGWQHPPAVAGACKNRNVADISAVADPTTGVAIYDSTLYGLAGGWAIFGGTSISAPIITGMYALSGDTARGQGAQTLYGASSASFLSVTSGSNGTCSPQYLCSAMAGYDGPSGLGIPQGLGGF